MKEEIRVNDVIQWQSNIWLVHLLKMTAACYSLIGHTILITGGSPFLHCMEVFEIFFQDSGTWSHHIISTTCSTTSQRCSLLDSDLETERSDEVHTAFLSVWISVSFGFLSADLLRKFIYFLTILLCCMCESQQNILIYSNWLTWHWHIIWCMAEPVYKVVSEYMCLCSFSLNWHCSILQYSFFIYFFLHLLR